MAQAFDDDWTNLLFVGRVIPNKRIENIIRCFHAYKRWFNPRSRLLLVGSHGRLRALPRDAARSSRRSARRRALPRTGLERGARRLLRGRGSVPVRERARGVLRAARWRRFTWACRSIAYAATAVPATMDGGGVLFTDKDPVHVAAMVDAVVSDHDLEDRNRRRRRTRRSRGCWPATSAACCCGFVDQVRAMPRAAGAAASPSTSGIGSRSPRSWKRSRNTARRAYGALPPPEPEAAKAPDRHGGRHDRQPVGAGRPQGRCHRRQRPPRARSAARAGPRLRDLRADDGRRPARTTSGRSPIRRGAQGRRHDLPFRAAVADDRRVRHAARCPRPAVPQRHAGALLRAATTPACSGWRRSAGASWRRSSATSICALGDSDFNRRELEIAGIRPDRGHADRRRHRRGSPTRRRGPPSSRLLDDGLVNFLFVGRIAPNKRIEDHIRLAEHYKRYVDAYYRFIFVGTHRRRAALLQDGPGADAEVPDAARSVLLHGPGARRRPGGVLPHADVYISLERARGLLRAAASRRWPLDVPVLAYARRRCPRRWAAPACQFAPKDLEYAAELLGVLAYDQDVRRRVRHRPARAARRFRRRSHRARRS